MLFIELTLTTVLHRSEKNNFSKRHKLRKLDLERKNFPHLAEDQPEVDHLWVGGQGKLLHHADEDGGHHQHGGQVHTEAGLEEEWLEESGGEGDCHEQDGGEVGDQHLAHDLPLEDDDHPHPLLGVALVDQLQLPVSHQEEGHLNLKVRT